MAQFPLLKTGAIAQYPVSLTIRQEIDIVWFLDGSEQRFRNAPSAMHEWQIELNKLDEQELSNIIQFIQENAAEYGSFSFTDPWTGRVFPSCSISGASANFNWSAPLSGETRLRIRENRI